MAGDGVFGVQAPSNDLCREGHWASARQLWLLYPAIPEEPDPMSPHRRGASPPAGLEHRRVALAHALAASLAPRLDVPVT